MAIDIHSLFNPGSLQQMAETEDDRKKKAQLTGTMNLGGQTGTFTGTFDPQAFQQMQNNMSSPVGYQPPPNYGMTAPPEQQPVPAIQPPAPTPPVGTSPISGEFSAPMAPPMPLPPGNQPYVAPPNYYGDLTPGQALGGEFTMQPPALTSPVSPARPDQPPPAMIGDDQRKGGFYDSDLYKQYNTYNQEQWALNRDRWTDVYKQILGPEWTPQYDQSGYGLINVPENIPGSEQTSQAWQNSKLPYGMQDAGFGQWWLSQGGKYSDPIMKDWQEAESKIMDPLLIVGFNDLSPSFGSGPIAPGGMGFGLS